MSYTSGLILELETTRAPLTVLELLLDGGWSATTGGHVTYLPLGDDGAFGWQSAPAEVWARVRHELAQKQGANQGLGLALFWQNGPFGGTFHLDPPHADSLTLWIVWYPERMRLLDAGGLTDHSWYLRRVVPPLVAAGIVVRSLSCSDG
jgi:hypothetical protein